VVRRRTYGESAGHRGRAAGRAVPPEARVWGCSRRYRRVPPLRAASPGHIDPREYCRACVSSLVARGCHRHSTPAALEAPISGSFVPCHVATHWPIREGRVFIRATGLSVRGAQTAALGLLRLRPARCRDGNRHRPARGARPLGLVRVRVRVPPPGSRTAEELAAARASSDRRLRARRGTSGCRAAAMRAP
jgi:hypothetical protein